MGKKLVIVDDKEVELHSRRREFGRIADLIHPRNISPQHLADASLILLDQHLDGEDWPERSTFPLACQPMTGVAVASVIRSHLRRHPHAQKSATALAVLTARLDELVHDSHLHTREAIAARAWGLDWAFEKNGTAASLLHERILEFLKAVQLFDVAWRANPVKNLEMLSQVLKLKDSRWRSQSVKEIGQAIPPFEGMRLLQERTSLLRWFSQRVLPYPCFLIDEIGVAARLGVKAEWLRTRLSSPESVLSKRLRSVRYRGPLSNFMGPRWWAAGVGSLMANAAPSGLTQEAVEKLAAETLSEPYIVKQPSVRVVDENIVPVGVAHVDDCNRVQLEDWPVFADSCWQLSNASKT